MGAGGGSIAVVVTLRSVPRSSAAPGCEDDAVTVIREVGLAPEEDKTPLTKNITIFYSPKNIEGEFPTQYCSKQNCWDSCHGFNDREACLLWPKQRNARIGPKPERRKYEIWRKRNLPDHYIGRYSHLMRWRLASVQNFRSELESPASALPS